MPSPRLCLTAAFLLLSTACVARVVTPVPRPPPPPPPAPRLLTADEAVAKGDAYCRSHGFACRLVDVNLHGNTWMVNYDATNPAARGRLHLEYDGSSHALVRADEPRPIPPPPPPPPPPAVRPMNSEEALRLGNEYCRARGYGCRLLDEDLRGNVWQLNFDAASPLARGRLHLEFDAVTRELLRAHEPELLPPPHPRKPMNSDEATRRGYEFCRSRRYDCRLRDADLAGGRVWKLNFDVLGEPHGHVHLEFDAHSHAMIEVNENVRS